MGVSKRWATVLNVLAVFVTSFAEAGAAAATELDASVCVVGQDRCVIPGSIVDLKLVLGSAESEIVAGQFAIQYDPTVLDFLAVAPGNACDPSSPFVLTIFSSVNSTTGSIIFAVATLPFVEQHDPGQPATMACLSFLPRQVATTSVCMLRASPGVSSLLVNAHGQPISVVDALDCPTAEPDPALSCRLIVVEDACRCVLGSDCVSLDTACREGVCDGETSFCTTVPSNEGNVCDDGNDCTTDDRCLGGRCLGSDCLNPSLCIEADDCDVASRAGRFLIRLGAGEPTITGGQFSLRYDPKRLRLVDIAPGAACVSGSPFTLETARVVDEVEGRIFYAAAVGLGGGGGTRGPAVLACVTFEAIGQSATRVCLFEEVNPLSTRLVDENGQSVVPFNEVDCPASLPAPITFCATPRTFCPIPAVSLWGLVILTVLLLIGAKAHFGRQRRAR